MLPFQLKSSSPFFTIYHFVKKKKIFISRCMIFKLYSPQYNFLSVQNYSFTLLSLFIPNYSKWHNHCRWRAKQKLQCEFGEIFYNNLYYNYSCAGFHELNMSCVGEWDVIEVNDKRQPVIEVVATWAYWTNPWLGHVTGCSPMVGALFTTKPGQLGKLISHLSCIW